MNYWSGDYLDTTHPVNDLSLEVTGPAAAKASRYTDLLWQYTCDHKDKSGVSVSSNFNACVREIAKTPPPVDSDKTPIIVVGHLGEGIDVPGAPKGASDPIPKSSIDGTKCPQLFSANKPDAVNNSRSYEFRNPGETALRALVASAQRSVFISQQDLLSCVPQPAPATEAKFDERLFSALAAKIHAGLKVRIVLSHWGGLTGGGYGNGWGLKDVAEALKLQIAAQFGISRGNARSEVCGNVGLAYISNDGRTTWPDGKLYKNHAKLVSVDNEAFYIGSENFYPSRLQELGMIVESPPASEDLRNNYLDPLWRYSRNRAFTDPETGKCQEF